MKNNQYNPSPFSLKSAPGGAVLQFSQAGYPGYDQRESYGTYVFFIMCIMIVCLIEAPSQECRSGHGLWGRVPTNIVGILCVSRGVGGSGIIWSPSMLKPNLCPNPFTTHWYDSVLRSPIISQSNPPPPTGWITCTWALIPQPWLTHFPMPFSIIFLISTFADAIFQSSFPAALFHRVR